MKDYSISYEDSKEFIKSYCIKDGQIIVTLANGTMSIPYTKKNEKKVLERMESQVRSASCDFTSKNDKQISRFLKWGLFALFLVAVNGALLLFGNPTIPWLAWLAFGNAAVALVGSSLLLTSGLIKKNDLKKNRFFLNKHVILNDDIVKTNENIKQDLDQKTIKVINAATQERPTFDINNIDGLSISQLEQIKKNIERELKFEFDYSTQDTIKAEEQDGYSKQLRPNKGK